jgi:hypothetical protein
MPLDESSVIKMLLALTIYAAGAEVTGGPQMKEEIRIPLFATK